MKRKILVVVSSLALLLSSGCVKLVNEYDESVEGIVIDKEYKESYTRTYITPIICNKTTVMIPRIVTYPEKYNIVIEYKDMQKTIDDVLLYSQYDIGDTIEMEIHYKIYSDDTIERELKVRD